jgi:deoxyribodipyrimidine photo-lyase
MRPLIWFRSDLRVDDNTALSNATRSADDGAVALFVISPAEWKAHDYAPARIDLVLRSLAELSRSLDALGIPLLIRTASKPEQVASTVVKACVESNCDAVFFNREYEVNEQRRDQAVIDALKVKGIHASPWHDQVVMEPATLRTGTGNIYTVFTPFKRAWIRVAGEQGGVEPRPGARKVSPCGIKPDAVPTSVPGFECPAPISSLWTAGEKHARARLTSFIEQGGRKYKDRRDTPSVDGTSGLSPHLAIGTISPRRCVAAAVAANTGAKSPMDSGSEGLTTWISELIWREFYVHIVHGFPRVCMHRAFQKATEAVRWNDDEAKFKAWQEGRTGIPIVDAGMRQLKATGWMHNRVRMITAMFLSKNLFIDWRRGERHFMTHLVDGFLASNNGGWQWSASTGTDAAPYFRIFNPVSQGERFDPEGEYVRRWVPELASLSNDVIQDPSSLSPLALTRLDYPMPIVDLGKSRLAAIEAFKKLRPA